MKKLTLSVGLVAALFVAGCQPEAEEQVMQQTLETQAMEVPAKEGMAKEVVKLLNQSAARETLLTELKGNAAGVKLETVLNKVEKHGRIEATRNLRKSVNASNAKLADNAFPDVVEVPELWLFEPAGTYNVEDILVSYAPVKGDEKEWEIVKAFSLSGDVVWLDAHEEPSVPVVVVETHGFEALKVEVEYMNQQLREAGLQKEFKPDVNARMMAGLETTKLTNIRLDDDQEPWVSGAAEIYAVTSGIRNSANEPELAVIPMYYLDHEDQTYYPNQILLFWDDYAYQAANIQLFEKDDNHNYKDLTAVLVDGVIKITGVLTGQTWLAALGEVAAAIIEATPDAWYSNDDDYVDSFYTIEKNKTYTFYYGAGRNARVSMEPFYVQEN